MPSDYERIRDAIVYIDENSWAHPTLDEVAAHVGLSPYHFQRLFTRWAGVSPKTYLQHLTAQEAKQLLRESKTVLDTTFDVGLSSSGRLHDLIVTTEAVTPGEFKTRGAGITISYGVHETLYGTALIGVTDRGICTLRFVDGEDAASAIADLRAEWHNASLVANEEATTPIAHRIFEATKGDSPLHLLLRGTNFQLKVWEGLLRVPEGSLISYGDLAKRLEMPSATRAVASAVGANPIAYVIPCHRVLRSTGALGGYRWGTDRKLVMIDRELALEEAL